MLQKTVQLMGPTNALIFLSLILMTGCKDSDEVSLSPELEILAQNKALWDQKGSSDYEYEYTKFCYPAYPFNRAFIIVNADTVNSILDLMTQQPLLDKDRYVYTVPELFLLIEIGIIQNWAKLNVQYHPSFGYPTEIDSDQSQAINDESFIWVQNLKLTFEP